MSTLSLGIKEKGALVLVCIWALRAVPASRNFMLLVHKNHGNCRTSESLRSLRALSWLLENKIATLSLRTELGMWCIHIHVPWARSSLLLVLGMWSRATRPRCSHVFLPPQAVGLLSIKICSSSKKNHSCSGLLETFPVVPSFPPLAAEQCWRIPRDPWFRGNSWRAWFLSGILFWGVQHPLKFRFLVLLCFSRLSSVVLAAFPAVIPFTEHSAGLGTLFQACFPS